MTWVTAIFAAILATMRFREAWGLRTVDGARSRDVTETAVLWALISTYSLAHSLLAFSEMAGGKA
jgi:hypothetical protein